MMAYLPGLGICLGLCGLCLLLFAALVSSIPEEPAWIEQLEQDRRRKRGRRK